MRTCRACGYISDNPEDFKGHAQCSGGRENICKVCWSKYACERARKQRDLINFTKIGRPCEICGVVYPPIVMDYHHKNVEDKEFTIGSSHQLAMTRIYKEIDKCMLVCANCHRLLHASQEED